MLLNGMEGDRFGPLSRPPVSTAHTSLRVGGMNSLAAPEERPVRAALAGPRPTGVRSRITAVPLPAEDQMQPVRLR